MTRRVFLYVALLAFYPLNLLCQEAITGIPSNKFVNESFASKVIVKGLLADTVSLPFFDDFSGHSALPDAGRWSDNNVFINNTYSDRQITEGIATFDALDSKGYLYESANSSSFRADQLTSKPINLAFPVSDSIWLSFVCEPGGLSDSPEKNDSLTLEFFAPGENQWHSVWRKDGSETKGFSNVILPVNQSRYLKKGFRFRFTNYASLGQNALDPSMIGNCDIWNVDYVYLNRNRNQGDTVFNDVAFRLPVRSVLKNHEAMPWKEFRQVYLQEMGSAIPVHYRNNDLITRNITRDFEIWDVYGNSQAYQFSAGATNIQPLTNADYNANLIYTFNSGNQDSALFRITCSLKTDQFDRKDNDTITYYQVFRNYFAFDDGSAEGGYGINGLGSRNAMMAYKYTSYMQDTITAIDICFNDSYQDANKRSFDIMVWSDNNGTPSDVLYSREEVLVEQGARINGFHRYYIPGGALVNGTFYVGWKQRSETFMNAGLDVNTPNRGRQMYWLNGSWNQSQVAGSVMIRPVVGKTYATGINDNEVKPEVRRNKVTIWPNPAGDYINVKLDERPYSSSAFVSIINLSGLEMLNVPLADQIDISSLNEGLYIVITTVNGKRIGYNRLVKTK
jgi:hypothetical protein